MEDKEMASAVGKWLAQKRWERASAADKKAVGKALADARKRKRNTPALGKPSKGVNR
jgi:hypothetical protein